MATAKPASDMPTDHDVEKPNHMIFWLDLNIGNPMEYTHLKEAFGSTTDPRQEVWTRLTDDNYHKLLVEENAVPVIFEGVHFLLQAFNDEEKCLAAFEMNRDKHIFFITSGGMGRTAVPKVIERYRNVFTDLVTDKPYSSVYIFCGDIAAHMEWASEYFDYVQFFDFDKNLLERMTRDIADYFLERGKRIRQDNDIEGALQHLHWAKRLQHQCDKMEQDITTNTFCVVKESRETKYINALIVEFEKELPSKSSDRDSVNSDDDDARPSEPSG